LSKVSFGFSISLNFFNITTGLSNLELLGGMAAYKAKSLPASKVKLKIWNRLMTKPLKKLLEVDCGKD